MSIVIILSSRTVFRHENLSLIIHYFRFGYFKDLLLVFYVPVIIIGKIVEFQGQFVVVITLRIVVGGYILAKHEAIFYDSDSRTLRILRAVNRINLNVRTARFFIFPTRSLDIFIWIGIADAIIFTVVISRSGGRLLLVFALTLHIFVEKKGFSRF